MKKKCFVSFILSALILLGTEPYNGTFTLHASADDSFEAKSADDMFTSRDYEVGYREEESVLIQLDKDTAYCESDLVQISGSTVTITQEGTYLLTGELENGMIIVDAKEDQKLHLVFDNVSIHSETSAPLYIKEADKVFVTLASDTSNELSNGGTFTAIDDNNIDGCIFSKQDLTFNGSGSLTVTSPAGHGIVCKDDLVFTSGIYSINAASHGLDANDSIRVSNASLNITSGKDGLHAENSDDEELGFIYILSGEFQIAAEGDGVSAGSFIQMEDGSFNILSGGGSENAQQKASDFRGNFMDDRRTPAMGEPPVPTEEAEDDSVSSKGIKAAGNLLINNGSFTLDTADDAVHSNTAVSINGGTFEISSGDDAVHSDENLTVSSGTINITQCYEGLEGLHIQISGGDITLTASDDGLNAAGGTDESGFGGPRGNDRFGGGSNSNGTLSISGGNLYITAYGDGIDANGSLSISGGNTTVCGPTSGDTSTLDYDTEGVITGGTFVGTGAFQMAQTFSDSQQGVISVSAGNQPSGTEIQLSDSAGNTVFTYVPALDFSVIILSSPVLVKGETYTLTVGSASADFTAN